ncbi:heptahelical transmembrane protein 4-like [Dendrobium catenatum]|nr:heptahelical transmembrane protein 4-like [Dendrobium catenatum]
MAASAMKMKKSSSFTKSSTQFLLSAPNNKTAKLELVDYDSLPEFLKHNEFIVSHYRSEWPLKQTILSIFSVHNETLNIWTHLIGFFIFLMLTGFAASVFPTASNAYPLLQLNSTNTFYIDRAQRTLIESSASSSSQLVGFVIPRWPFYLYLAGAMFCLLMSSACHLLSCHCHRTSYIMLRLDFAGISGLIVSSFYPLVYYTFTCNPFFRDLYLASITFFGLATVIISLTPVFDSAQFRPVRAVLFACMAASGVVPIAHKMMAFGHRPEAVLTTGYEAVMGMFYVVGVVIYVARVPERWLPGKFDLAGQSHQLFHVLVVAGAYTQYLGSLVYLGWREVEGC